MSRPDPEYAHHFKVEIDSILSASFSECSGLQVETEFDEIQVGGVNDHRVKLAKGSKYANLVLRRGLASGELWKWHQRVVGGAVERKDVHVILLGPGLKERHRWSFKGAFPVKWTGPDLKAESGAVAIETLEIAHHGLVNQAGGGRRA